MNHSDRKWLLDALQHIDTLNRHLSIGNVDDQLVLDAVALRLSSAIESVAHVSDELRRPVIPDEVWRKIKGTRNRIAHEYGFIDPPILRTILTRDASIFEADIRLLLERAD